MPTLRRATISLSFACYMGFLAGYAQIDPASWQFVWFVLLPVLFVDFLAFLADKEITPGYWRTRDGRIANITSVNGNFHKNYPVRGFLEGEEELWTRWGKFLIHKSKTEADLIRKVKNHGKRA